MLTKRLQRLGQVRLHKSEGIKDVGILGAFVCVIAVMALLAVFVATRFASERAHREKWSDYNDCGWA